VQVNTLRANPLAPFGGYKQSGDGREWGAYGFEEFLQAARRSGEAHPVPGMAPGGLCRPPREMRSPSAAGEGDQPAQAQEGVTARRKALSVTSEVHSEAKRLDPIVTGRRDAAMHGMLDALCACVCESYSN
jgi:hypothetical protein